MRAVDLVVRSHRKSPEQPPSRARSRSDQGQNPITPHRYSGRAAARQRGGDDQFRQKRSHALVRTVDGTHRDRDTIVDANLRRYAHDASKRAHAVGLCKRGAVTKQAGQFLLIERRGGTVNRLKSLPATPKVQSGEILSKKR